jgi:TonB family protein
MEAFALYLLKSVAWLTGFTLVFILFLRNERFFLLSRIYLLAGILISFLFPLISIHYTVVLPVVSAIQTENVVAGALQSSSGGIIPYLKLILLVLYVSGVLIVLSILLRQGRSVIRTIRRSEISTIHPVKLIRTTDYTSAFSFFSYVFVNPSITDVETKEIMNHELVHIRQKHWFDLLLGELLCMLQWFNPLAWIFIRFIRQNHEYLADEVALQRTSDPAIYRAVLLNQIAGFPVVSLANSFNYSLNKKRFSMMKNIISSPYRKMKILFILPVFAIMFYAFAKPDYKFNYSDASSGNIISASSLQQKSVRGKVVQNDGTPLPGATIILKGSTTGTSADATGSFKLDNVPDNGLLVVSFVGFKPKVLKPVFTSEMAINMVKDTIKYMNSNISTPPPPPAPLPEVIVREANAKDVPQPSPSPYYVKIRSENGKTPLVVVDGVVKDIEVDKIDPETVASMNVLKDEFATNKYGEKAKDGVVEISTKKIQAGADNNLMPPPPAAFPNMNIRSGNGQGPLYVVDGITTEKGFDIKSINTDNIASITVLKDKSAVTLYGEKAQNGVIIITTKKTTSNVNDTKSEVIVTGYADNKTDKSLKTTSPVNNTKSEVIVTGYADNKTDKSFVVVEQMPMFPGGENAMVTWITSNLKYPGKAVKDKIEGNVTVNFLVTGAGKIKNVKVLKAVNPLLDEEAVRVISSMPDWIPGSQAGKQVAVQMQVPVEFKLH